MQLDIANMDLITKACVTKLTWRRRGLNSTRPFNQLPIEIASEVLKMAVGIDGDTKGYYKALIPLRSVSSHLHNIIDSSPAFWVQNGAMLHPGLVALALRNSGSRPLHVKLDQLHPSANLERQLAQIVAHARRWEALSVDPAGYWVTILKEHAPPLKRLEIKSNPPDYSRILAPPSLSVPSLLTHLDLSYQIIPIDILTRLLSLTSNLEWLSLDKCNLTPTSPLIPITTVALTQLQSFRIRISSTADTILLLESISCPKAWIKARPGSLDSHVGAMQTNLLNCLRTLAEPHTDDPALFPTIGLLLQESVLKASWGDMGEVSITLNLEIVALARDWWYDQILGHSEKPMQIFLGCAASEQLSSLISTLDRCYPKATFLKLMGPFDETIIELLSRPVEKGADGVGRWWLPNLVCFQIGKTKDLQTFDRVVELVEARAASEEVQSLKTVTLAKGAISKSSRKRLKELVELIELNLLVS